MKTNQTNRFHDSIVRANFLNPISRLFLILDTSSILQLQILTKTTTTKKYFHCFNHQLEQWNIPAPLHTEVKVCLTWSRIKTRRCGLCGWRSGNVLGSSLMICFSSSSNPTSKMRSASSMIRHCRFLNMKPGVFWGHRRDKTHVPRQYSFSSQQARQNWDNSTMYTSNSPPKVSEFGGGSLMLGGEKFVREPSAQGLGNSYWNFATVNTPQHSECDERKTCDKQSSKATTPPRTKGSLSPIT